MPIKLAPSACKQVSKHERGLKKGLCFPPNEAGINGGSTQIGNNNLIEELFSMCFEGYCLAETANVQH